MEGEASSKSALVGPNSLIINYQTTVSTGTLNPKLKDAGRTTILIGILSTLSVVSHVSTSVILPLFNASVEGYSDPYFVVFASSTWLMIAFWTSLLLGTICNYIDPRVEQQKYLVLMGILRGIVFLIVVYASDPNRTPPYLQAVLRTSTIPFTVFFRYILLKKGVSKERLICTFAVLIGLSISLEPAIFNMDSSKKDQEIHQSGVGNVLWPVCFLLAFVPVAIINVILEKELIGEDLHSLTVASWLHLYSFLTVTFLFWTDFMPSFGMAKNARQFWEYFSIGHKCQFGVIEGCRSVVLRSWLYIIACCSTSIFSLVLIKTTSSSVYLVIVQAITTPVSALILKLFKSSPTTFVWLPVFDESLVFLLVGLLIIVPAVILYNILAVKEKRGHGDIQEYLE